MEHKLFRVISIICLFLIFSSIVGYNYCVIYDKIEIEKLLLKTIPLFLMIVLNIFYIGYYQLSVYASLTLISLFFCFLGDIFLGLYSKNNEVYMIFGGISFLISRTFMMMNFMMYPSRKFKLIQHVNTCKVRICHIICIFLVFPLIPILLIISNYDTNSILFIIYLVSGFPLPTSYAFLRIGELDNEIYSSSIFAFIGICLFNISDILLFITMFTNLLPFYVNLISNNIYWIGIYLITISIIRYPTVDMEKRNYFYE